MLKEGPLLGFLHGIGDDAGAKVAVYKAGRTYRITYRDERHLCHPSVTSIAKAKRETFLAFNVTVDEFEPL